MSPRALSFLAVTFLVGARQAFNKGWSRGLMNGSWFLDLGAQRRGHHRTAVHVRLRLLRLHLPSLSLHRGPNRGRGSRGGVWHVFLLRRAAAAGVREMAEIYVSLTKAGGDRGEASISSGVAAARGGGASGGVLAAPARKGATHSQGPGPQRSLLLAQCVQRLGWEAEHKPLPPLAAPLFPYSVLFCFLESLSYREERTRASHEHRGLLWSPQNVCSPSSGAAGGGSPHPHPASFKPHTPQPGPLACGGWKGVPSGFPAGPLSYSWTHRTFLSPCKQLSHVCASVPSRTCTHTYTHTLRVQKAQIGRSPHLTPATSFLLLVLSHLGSC